VGASVTSATSFPLSLVISLRSGGTDVSAPRSLVKTAAGRWKCLAAQ